MRRVVRLCPKGKWLRCDRRSVSASYKATCDFEPLLMRYFCDGNDADTLKDLKGHLQQLPVLRPAARLASSPDKEVGETRERLRSIASCGVFSPAQARSTPLKAAAGVELLSFLSGPLALSAASNFMLSSQLIAGHGSEAARDELLPGMASGDVLGTLSHAELNTQESPLGTTAKYDPITKEFVLNTGDQGNNKFAVVNGLSADVAVVVADVVISNTNHGPHLFAVPLRSHGKLATGISVRSPGRAGALDGLGLALVRFTEVRIPRSAMFDGASTVSEQGELLRATEDVSPLLPLVTASRIASATVCIGRSKRLLRDLVYFAASRQIVGPFGELSHPLFSLQHIQNELVSLLAELFVIIAAYHRTLKHFEDPQVDPPAESLLQLALVSSRSQSLLSRIASAGLEISCSHGSVSDAGFAEALALCALLREGASDTHVDRLAAREIVTHGYGFSHPSSMLKNQLGGGFLKRFVSNPFFSPTSQELNRYLILFTDREYARRTSLEQKFKAAQRSGPEDLFFAWNNEEHRLVRDVSSAYAERFFLESMIEEIHRCSDATNRRVLRDLGWQYSLQRIENDLGWLLSERLFSPRHIYQLHQQMDSICGNIAHQAVHLVDAFGIPEWMISSPVGKDWEREWSVR